ncbi:hypothetical protein FAZ15_03795 [Sphingobacterium olei]|uniref:Uncharacterized protein n=1 Tax=Sphingobacterium olei TaxID=2571155 RepID=A0A4U0PKF8_9SPHI|nr:hypothetical protein [Sphingobacterium olei]TJZ63414.1 hypothetical protein FAZ15_03795 [Sphingobacterium olei]
MNRRKSKRIWFIAIPVTLILGYLIWQTYSQPTLKDIPGNFEEVAFVRNEQNKGGIVRIYAVTVDDASVANYDACADLFPTNDFNSITTIYFFDKKKPYPTVLTLESPHYDTEKYSALYIAKRRGTD